MGRLRLVDPQGREVPIASAKVQALLALLGTAPELRRQRAFLQDKLWSSSEPEKGSASLRQLLTMMRRALGPWRDALLSAPGWVGLDPSMVTVVTEPDPADWGLGDEPPEFAAGLDVADPEFEDWLRDQRLAAEDRLADAAPPRHSTVVSPPAEAAPAPTPMALNVAIDPPSATGGDLLPLADLITGEIAAQMRSETGVTLLFGYGTTMPPPTLHLAVRAAALGSRVFLQAAWLEEGSRATLAVARRTIAQARNGAGAALDELIAEAAIAGLVILQRQHGAESLGVLALASVPVLADAASTGHADRMLAASIDRLGAIALAHRAQLRVVARMERFGALFPDGCEEAIAFVRRASELDPSNAAVKAVAAEVALHLERAPEKALMLAEEAQRQAPASALARSSYAHALSFTGHEKAAHREAKRALRLANGHPRIASWRLFCATTALRCGLFEEAEIFAAMAHDAIPSFRPPLRFLAGLRWHRGDEAGAAAALRALKAAEPDFDLPMLADPDYPAASLRAAGLTRVARSGLL